LCDAVNFLANKPAHLKRERNPKVQSGVDNPDTGNIGNKAPNADKQNTKTITTKHTTQKIKKMNNIEHHNFDVPHDIRVLQEKTLTNDTDTYFCVMQSTS
jgi:hypothetical protein